MRGETRGSPPISPERAAGLATGRHRPASINVHFVGGARSGPVEITARINRTTRVATSATVQVEQNARPYLVATVWGIDGDLGGLAHHTEDVPDDVPDPAEIPSTHQRTARVTGGPPHPFWRNVEQRVIDWVDDWEHRPARPPVSQTWYRFVDGETCSDPWVDACRALVVLDVDAWRAASMPHVGNLDHFAPTIELSARFVGSAGPWLYSRAEAPIAADGLIAAAGSIWNVDRRLVAVGGSTLLCRPAAKRPDQ